MHIVFRKEIAFEFPAEVLQRCGLRPNQKISGRKFWQALVCHANFILETNPAYSIILAEIA